MINKILLILIMICVSCSKNEFKRKPTSVGLDKSDLIEINKRIQESVNDKMITKDNCNEVLNDYMDKFDKISPVDYDSTQVELDGQTILNESFLARYKLHTLLSTLPESCNVKIKNLFYSMRSIEDLVGVLYYKDEQISADSLDYQKEKTPIYEKEAYHPYQLAPGMSDKNKFEFKNGDIMITKGISFVSSTISEIANPKSLFSHIVFIHVDEKTKAVSTIESYVGKGVEIYPIEVALRNENARILVLRPKNQELAAKAANYMYDKVVQLRAKKKIIPYDYDLDFSDNKKLSCEEVAYDAFKTMSNGTFVIPEQMSLITLSDKNFLDRIGIKKGPMMVPSDMETDSRFEIVLDWTDYRIMRDSWRKDAVLGEMFRWSEEHKYSIHENFTSIAARVVWATRYIPGLWNMMAKVSGLPKDFTKDVPSKTIATMASLKGIGGELLPVVTKADEDYFKLTGRWLSSKDLRKSLESYRVTHPKKLEKVYRPRKN